MTDRWPAKPVKGSKCDTVSYGSSAVLDRCKNEAVETVFMAQSNLGIPSWLCAECIEKLDTKGLIRRNPKSRRRSVQADVASGPLDHVRIVPE